MKKKLGVNLKRVKDLWEGYNRSVWEGALSPPIIRITRSRSYFGNCVTRSSNGHRVVSILISARCCVDLSLLKDTLLHEMIHQWQNEKGLIVNEHDQTFLDWIPIIKQKTGISLDMSYLNEEEVNSNR